MTHLRRQVGLAGAVLLVFAGTARADVVVPDDQVVQGNHCTGLPCLDGEPFGASDIAELKSTIPDCCSTTRPPPIGTAGQSGRPERLRPE
jgi:hypothetical protein